MTWYDRIKEKLTTEGYIIYRQTYQCGTTVYSIRTPKVNGECSIFVEVAADIVRMLCVELNVEIHDAPEICVALNYKPTPVDKGCVRYTTYEYDKENKVLILN